MMITLLRRPFLAILLVASLGFATAPLRASEDAADVTYGQNASAGATYEVNGIPLYYETYGQGEPLLIIHPNGGSISAMAPQIEFFAKKYKVIAADSRGFGKSPAGEGALTYEKMTADLEALMEHLEIKSYAVLGWSDGGIIGLMMSIDHPERITRLAVMGANLNPEGAEPWAVDWVKRTIGQVDGMIEKHPEATRLKDMRQMLTLMSEQPHIPVENLQKITAPTLVMAGDKDIIRAAHTLEIFQGLPHAQLCIFPGATHQISHQDPERFNRTVDDFLGKPFERPDSKDGMK